MPIRFVYFDLGNVLWTFDRTQAAANVARLLEVDASRADMVLHGDGLQEALEHGRLSSEQYVHRVCEGLDRLDWLRSHVDATGPAKRMAQAISDMFTPVESMVGVAARVRKEVGGVGILSNTCEAHWEWIRLQNHPVTSEPWDAVVLSYKVGSMKPDAAIYDVAERSAGCAADQILFIDDRSDNVDAARRRGWQAEVCRGGEPAIEVLKGAGVLS